MPLRAVIAGEEVIAPTLSEAEWEALREAVQANNLPVILPCCDGEGYLRRSKYGTQHFAHKRGAGCDATGETFEHLAAKAEIVVACRRAGYAALPEVAGDDWRADVLATRGAARIAFEVQWSFLRLDQAIFRQDRYARDGVRGCWFFRNPPPALARGGDLKARADLPLFHLWANADASFSLSLNGRLYPLGAFVEVLLRGGVRFCETAHTRDAQMLALLPLSIPCPACGRTTLIYRIDPTLTARCGRTFAARPLEFRREVLAAVRTLTQQQPHLRFGAVEARENADGKRILGFTCANCGAALTPEAIELALYGTDKLRDAERYPLSVTLTRPITARAAHWCYPDDGVFCCDKA